MAGDDPPDVEEAASRGGGESTERSTESDVERAFQRVVELSEFSIEALELLTGIVLVGLFAVGLFDLVLQIIEAIRLGTVFQVSRVVDFIDTVLLLLIIAEVFRTVIAFALDESVIRVIIDAAVIAVARKVISFRPGEYGTPEELFVQTVTIALLLTVVIAAFYVVRRTEAQERMPAAGRFDPRDGTEE